MGLTLVTGRSGFVGSNTARTISSSILFDWRKPGYLFRDESRSDLIYEKFDYSIQKIERALDYEPQFSLEGEIRRILKKL